MYKVQRINSKSFVLTELYSVAVSMAKEDAKTNDTLLIIYEEKNGKWYKIEAISKMYKISPRSRGYEIAKCNGKSHVYLKKVYNGEYTWTLDYTYSKIYTNFNTALSIFKALNK